MGRRGRDPRVVGTRRGGSPTLDGHLRSPLLPLPASPSEGQEQPPPTEPEWVSLRPIKDLVGRLDQNHPLRILLLGEPDEMLRWEYGSKLSGWLRLLYRSSG